MYAVYVYIIYTCTLSLNISHHFTDNSTDRNMDSKFKKSQQKNMNMYEYHRRPWPYIGSVSLPSSQETHMASTIFASCTAANHGTQVLAMSMCRWAWPSCLAQLMPLGYGDISPWQEKNISGATKTNNSEVIRMFHGVGSNEALSISYHK